MSTDSSTTTGSSGVLDALLLQADSDVSTLADGAADKAAAHAVTVAAQAAEATVDAKVDNAKASLAGHVAALHHAIDARYPGAFLVPAAPIAPAPA